MGSMLIHSSACFGCFFNTLLVKMCGFRRSISNCSRSNCCLIWLILKLVVRGFNLWKFIPEWMVEVFFYFLFFPFRRVDLKRCVVSFWVQIFVCVPFVNENKKCWATTYIDNRRRNPRGRDLTITKSLEKFPTLLGDFNSDFHFNFMKFP